MSRVKRGCSPYVSSLAKGAREIFVRRQLSKLLHGCPRLVRWPIFVVVTVVVTHLRFHRLFPSTSLLPSFLPPAHTHHVPHLTSDRWFTREDLLLAKFYERLWPATETRRVSSLLFLSKNEKIIFYEEQGLYTLIGELLERRKIVGRGLSKNMCESRRWLRTVGWSMFERLYYYSSLINAVATCSSPRLPNRRHGFHAVNRSGSINHNQWRLEGVTARSVASRLKRFWNGEEM